MTKVVVDGDTVCYKAAFATQYQTYVFEEQAWRYHKELKQYLQFAFDGDERPDIETDVVKTQVLEPLNHSLHIVNKIIESITEDTKATSLSIFLSGDKNFRKHIPYPVEYKGHRPEKPVRLPEIRQYLMDRYKAVVCDGYEADDALGIYASENHDCIMAHVDKDIYMIPGKHYHLDSKVLTEVEEVDGFRSFYRQMLMGDRADNIMGIDGIGIKTAEKLIDKLVTQEQMENVVRQKYKEFFKDNWYSMYRSNKDLLWILRSREELEGVKKEYEDAISKSKRKETSTVDERQDSTGVQPT